MPACRPSGTTRCWSGCGRRDLAVLRELLQAGKITPVIGRAYPLSEVAEAIGYLETGHAREKSSSPYEPF
jgi:NADPH:quinone reductase-like Zn-dependent oxidoreductase